MSAYNKFNSFVDALDKKVHNLGSDSLKVALTNVAPVATNTQLSNITEIAYTFLSARGLTTTSASQTAGLFSLVLASLILTSTGGSTGPFRYIVIYNDTATNKELICWFEYQVGGVGASVTLADGETLTLSFGADLFTLQ